MRRLLPSRAAATRLVACTPLRLGGLLAIALLACAPCIPFAAGMNDFHDAQYLSAYERHALISVRHFLQLPLWDPYSCGGMYGLSAPQTRFASPFFLLTLLLGVERASVVLFVLLPALSMEGMYRYARSWGALSLPALAMAPAFPLCGFFAHSFQYGWVHFLSFCLVPWILLFLRRALRGDARAALLCAVTIAATVGFGGSYTLPMTMVLAPVELFDALLPRLGRFGGYGSRTVQRAGGAVRGLLLLIPLVLGIAAFRLWPMLESVEATMRTMGGQPTLEWSTIMRLAFVAATPKAEDVGHFYVAPMFSVLALVAGLRGRVAAWLGALVAFGLAFGHAHPLAPFSLLRALPVYDTLRYPERYLLLFGLMTALLAALGATRLVVFARRFGGRRLSHLTLGLLGLLTIVGTLLARENIRVLLLPLAMTPAPALRDDAPFRQARGNRWMMSHFAPEGMGSLACGEAYPVPMSTRLRGDLPAEEYLVTRAGTQPASGEVQRVAWSPNRLELRVLARERVRLAINQNHHPGWQSSAGEVVSWEGLLAVDLPAGTHQVVLTFRPRSGLGGLATSMVALLMGCIAVLRPPRKLLARALTVTAGPLMIALLMLTWREPRWRRPEPRTEQGAPVLLSVLPPEATPMAVRFEAPLALEGVRLSRTLPRGAAEVPIELYFRRREGALSASLGIFVHLIGPSTSERGDHATLSGALYLPRLAVDALARDAFRVALPDQPAGTWTVRVGLWDAFGSGARSRVVSADPAVVVHEDAVEIGRFEVAP